MRNHSWFDTPPPPRWVNYILLAWIVMVVFFLIMAKTAQAEEEPLSISDLITQAALEYQQDPTTMVNIAWCESRMNPWAYNRNGHYGLFQFDDATWKYASLNAGFSGSSPFDPTANAYSAAWLITARGYQPWKGNCA